MKGMKRDGKEAQKSASTSLVPFSESGQKRPQRTLPM